MGALRIQHTSDDTHDIVHEGRRVAVLLPPVIGEAPDGEAGPWVIRLDPVAFPDFPASDLPHPLHDGFMAFDVFADAKAFLGLAQLEVAA